MNSREWLCLWYLRLNGYFTLPNFIAHGRRGPLTEVDVLGTRFQHSREFEDDPALRIPADRTDIVFAEAKRKRIDELNGPWSSPEKGALDYVLRRVGIVNGDELKALAQEVYEKRTAIRDGVQVRIVCFADTIGEQLANENVTFIPWAQVLAFIHNRFRGNARLKEEHVAWDEFGQYLWRTLAERGPIPSDEFFAGWDRRGNR